eukprot:888035-Amorphochlora_amoeboformis.AAC.1
MDLGSDGFGFRWIWAQMDSGSDGFGFRWIWVPMIWVPKEEMQSNRLLSKTQTKLPTVLKAEYLKWPNSKGSKAK